MDYERFERLFGALRASKSEPVAEQVVWRCLQAWGWSDSEVEVSRISHLPLRKTAVIPDPVDKDLTCEPDFGVSIPGGVVIVIEAKGTVRDTGPWEARLHAELGCCVELRPKFTPFEQLASYGNRVFRSQSAGPHPWWAVLTNGFTWLVFPGDMMVNAWHRRTLCTDIEAWYKPLRQPRERCAVARVSFEPPKRITIGGDADLQQLQALLGRHGYPPK